MNPNHDKVRHAFILILSLVAGCVDAVSFVNAGVFPANMTGNSVVLAASLVNHGSFHGETHAWLVLLGFCFGSALAALIIRSPQFVWSRGVNAVLLLAALCLVGCGLSMQATQGVFSAGTLFGLSFAMGMQAATVLHLNFPGAGTTTAVTSTLTAVVMRAVHHLRGALIPGFAIHLSSPWFPLLVFTVYFCGALLGGFQIRSHAPIATIISGVLLALVALGAERISTGNKTIAT